MQFRHSFECTYYSGLKLILVEVELQIVCMQNSGAECWYGYLVENFSIVLFADNDGLCEVRDFLPRLHVSPDCGVLAGLEEIK